ncbi:MAG: hypothetical protein VKJ24_01850 [Synechococcales bacterium]|nr:hypothetical protein [Synechococcales bacterium]
MKFSGLPAKKFLLSLGLGLGALAVGVNGCFPGFSTPIAEIQRSQENSVIQVSGTVITVAPMLGQAAYEVADDRGNSLWILTKDQPPTPNSQVTVRGTLRYQSVTIEGEDLGSLYLEQ